MHRLKATPVSAIVKVRIDSITGSDEAIPDGQAYMVWLRRNGKARGTGLVWAKRGHVSVNETVSLRMTLYQNRDGSWHSKVFDLQV